MTDVDFSDGEIVELDITFDQLTINEQDDDSDDHESDEQDPDDNANSEEQDQTRTRSGRLSRIPLYLRDFDLSYRRGRCCVFIFYIFID